MTDIRVNAWLRRAVSAVALLVSLSFATTADAAGVPAAVLDGLNASSVRVRIASIVAISKSGALEARPLLEKALADDKAAPARAAALEGLERLGDPAALPAVERALKDESALVRKIAARAQKTLSSAMSRPTASGPAIPVDLSDVADISDAGFPGLAELLRDELVSAIEKDRSRDWQVGKTRGKKGYGLIVRVRAMRPFEQDGVNGIEARCEMTVVKLPSKALRLSLRANAAAGVQGALRDSSKPGIARDGVKACAAALATDFIDYAFSRPPP